MSRARAGCWPDPVVSHPCWSAAASGLQQEAADVASSILWYNTGGQFDLCSVVYRPCSRCTCGCSSWVPYIRDGRWYNGCQSCRDWCCGANEVILPSNAYAVSQVLIGSRVLDPTEYRVDHYRRLVRIDGPYWPHCQNMDALPGAEDTFTVTYQQSRLDAAGMRAYSTLAGEILASWVDTGNCHLPQGIRSMTREGVTIDFDILGEMASRTGIVEVDLWLKMVNPAGLAHALSVVISPDTLRRGGRTTTS